MAEEMGHLPSKTNVQVNNAAPYVVSFAGTLANAVQPMLTANISLLTGTGVSATISETTQGGVTAFTDTELNLLYTDAGADNFALAIALGFDVLVAGGAKFNDFTAGQTSEKKSQITEHLKERAEFWHQWANNDRQVQTTRMIPVPPAVRAVPVSAGTPATSLRYGPNGYPPWRRGPWGWGG